MCDILKNLENYMKEQNLPKETLKYQYTINVNGTRLICSDGESGISYSTWQENRKKGSQGEVRLNIENTYWDWNSRLKKDPESVIKEILNWGFGETTDKNREGIVEKHCNSIKNLFKYGKENIDEILFQRKDKLFSKSWENIASWSKVLSAFDPDNYFIYDSRVAVALNIISPEEWYLPEEHGHTIVFALIKNGQNTRPQRKESYKRYCESLRREGGRELERSLFMLGKMLDFKCDNWRKYIFVKS